MDGWTQQILANHVIEPQLLDCLAAADDPHATTFTRRCFAAELLSAFSNAS
jgi:hypothetical protein